MPCFHTGKPDQLIASFVLSLGWCWMLNFVVYFRSTKSSRLPACAPWKGLLSPKAVHGMWVYGGEVHRVWGCPWARASLAAHWQASLTQLVGSASLWCPLIAQTLDVWYSPPLSDTAHFSNLAGVRKKLVSLQCPSQLRKPGIQSHILPVWKNHGSRSCLLTLSYATLGEA